MDAHTYAPASVKMLGLLHGACRERGVPTRATVEVPAEGVRAIDLATSLGAPAELVESLFLNGGLVGPGAIVLPGDRVAFVPYGTPATHPAFFGREGIARTGA